MRVIFVIVLSGLFVLATWVGPWWALAAPAFVAGWLTSTARRTFALAGLAGFLAWVGMALLQDIQTGFRLSHRISGVFSLPWQVLIFPVMGLIAGLLAASAALSGYFLKRTFQPSKSAALVEE